MNHWLADGSNKMLEKVLYMNDGVREMGYNETLELNSEIWKIIHYATCFIPIDFNYSVRMHSSLLE